jgi:hypothetical protein
MAYKDVGALWTREGKTGKFTSGHLDLEKIDALRAEAKDGKLWISLWKVGEKKNPKQPDFKIQVKTGLDEPPKPKDEEMPF